MNSLLGLFFSVIRAKRVFLPFLFVPLCNFFGTVSILGSCQQRPVAEYSCLEASPCSSFKHLYSVLAEPSVDSLPHD